MTRSFIIKADRVAITEAFSRNGFEGVSIRAVPAKDPQPVTKADEPVYALDSAEDILHFVVNLGTETSVAVFSAWLYDLLKKTNSKKTTLNGQMMPGSPEQIADLIGREIEATAMVSRQRLPSSTKAYFIKLGRGGGWEKTCLAEGTLNFGYKETPHDLCLRGDWDAVRDVWRRERSTAGAATSDSRQIRTFYTASTSDLFITFFAKELYWCRPSGPVELLEDGNRLRRTVDGWHHHSIGGMPLTSDRLPGELLIVQMYQGTICEVTNARDSLIRKINDDPLPQVLRAVQAEEDLVIAIIGLVRLLHPEDFELLIDLTFSASGWRRSSTVGGSQKTTDFDLSLPTTGERAFVQAKGKTDPGQFREYVEQLADATGYDRMFYVWHTGDIGSAVPKKVTPWGPERVARAVLDAGLLSWLKRKVG